MTDVRVLVARLDEEKAIHRDRMAELRASIGAALRARREALGLSCRAVALRLEYDTSNLSKIEGGSGKCWSRPAVDGYATLLDSLEADR